MKYLAIHQILKLIQNEIPGRSKIMKINAERNMPSVTVHPMHAKRYYFSNTCRALLILKCIQSVTIPQMHAKRYYSSNACKALLFLKNMQSVSVPQIHAKRWYSSNACMALLFLKCTQSVIIPGRSKIIKINIE